MVQAEMRVGGEQVHSVLKSALAGGRLPSGLFGGPTPHGEP